MCPCFHGKCAQLQIPMRWPSVESLQPQRNKTSPHMVDIMSISIWDITHAITHMRPMVLEYAHQHDCPCPKSPSHVGKYTSTMGCIWVMGFLTGISNMHMAKSIRRIKASVYLISPFLIVDSVIPKIGFMAKAAGKPKPCIWRWKPCFRP